MREQTHSRTAFDSSQDKGSTKIDLFPQIAEGETFENVPTTDEWGDAPTYITDLTFGYGILFFRKSREAKDYVATGLYHTEIRTMLEAAGFAKRRVGEDSIPIRVRDNRISEIKVEKAKDFITSYVNETEGYHFEYSGREYHIPPETVRETYYRNSHNIFNKEWLQHLSEHTAPILKDTQTEMFFPFRNAIVSVTKSGITARPWDEVTDGCVWEQQVIPHDFNLSTDPENGHFYQFLRNVTSHDNRRWQTMVTGIGYLMHHHFRESEGQAVIFYDEAITDTRTPQGGTGKGLIVNAIRTLRDVAKVDGKHLDNTDKFRWQVISPSTQVVQIDDVKTDFDFSMLHSNLTDGWTVERKYLPKFIIPPKDSPKTVICSNSIIKGGGSTNVRRQFIIELSDYYSRQIVRGDEKPIEDTHGCLFFGEQWDVTDWSRFFTFMLDCARQYLCTGLIAFEGVNVEVNRFRQSTSEDFAEWVEDADLPLNEKLNTKTYYNSYTETYNVTQSTFTQRKFSSWIKDYAAFKGLRYERSKGGGQQFFTLKSA